MSLVREDKLPAQVLADAQERGMHTPVLRRHLATRPRDMSAAKQEILIIFVILQEGVLDLLADVGLGEKHCKCSVNLVGVVHDVQSVPRTLITFSASLHAFDERCCACTW